MKDTVANLNWAINTIRDRLMFGRDELGAALARETRAKGVMIDAVKYIEQLERENKIIKEELLSTKVFCESLRYSKPDGQDIQMIIDDINKVFNDIGE
jgi:hypothetical protein